MKKLITTDGTKYAQNLKAFAIIDDKQTDGKPIMVDANVLEEAFENASEADKAAFENVIHFDVEGEEIEVTPTTSQQVKTLGKGYNAITKATIKAVTSAIDANIIPENIVEGKTILGVAGTFPDPRNYDFILNDGSGATDLSTTIGNIQPTVLAQLMQGIYASADPLSLCFCSRVFIGTGTATGISSTKFAFASDGHNYTVEQTYNSETQMYTTTVTEVEE